MKSELVFGYEATKALQDYENIALVVSQAFGGKKKQGGPPANFEEAEVQLNKVLGI